MEPATATPPRPPRRRHRVTIGTLVVAIGVFALVASRHTNAWRAQRRAIAKIVTMGGFVRFDYEFVDGDPDGTEIVGASVPGPVWLRRRIGDEPFGEIVDVMLTGDSYRDDDLAVLEGLTGVRRLMLFNTSNITNAGLEHFRNLHHLQHLNIYRQKAISDAGLAHLRGLTSLETLHLDGSRVTDAGLDSLRRMERLRELDIDGTPVGNAGLAKLADLPHLRQVYVQNSRTTKEGVDVLKKSLPDVRVELGAQPGSYGK